MAIPVFRSGFFLFFANSKHYKLPTVTLHSLHNINFKIVFIKIGMRILQIDFSGQIVTNYFDASFDNINGFYDPEKIIIITEDHIFNLHSQKFENFKVLLIEGKEKNKTQDTINFIIDKLLYFNIDKSWLIIGVGGGVITDMVGYVANIFKRGINLGIVPTTILAMTDAAIGGKNGINIGQYKNMVGTTYRPSLILYDYSFLDTLSKSEWVNGFAEIIKHACIKDEEMFYELETKNIEYYIKNRTAAAQLIEQNVAIKTAVVVADEFEKADRFQLNFGHTFGHAIENLYTLPHGHAVSIGMVMAAKISQKVNNFDSNSVDRLKNLLLQYELPISQKMNAAEVLELLVKDKKRAGETINFVLLNKIGEGTVKQLSFHNIAELLDQTL